ncbi:DUF485 domain-containing protein, partial [Streptomyces broussonetiae]
MQSSNGRARGAGDDPDSSAGNREDHGAPAHDVTYEDPWYDAPASGWGERDGVGMPVPVVPSAREERSGPGARARDVYVEVQRS